MATKIIKAWIDGAIQEIEVEDITSPAQPLSVEERIDTLEDKHEVIVTKGNLLVGDGTPELKEITPNEVLSHINGASVMTLTTEEYEALEETNANTLYMLTDSEEENQISLDTTLSVEGKAADAKAVGDALAEKQPKGNYLTSYTETDPTVPAWAKASKKPSYTASEVGADASGTAESLVNAHNIATDAHADIRESIANIQNKETLLFANSLSELESNGDITKKYVLPDGYIYEYNNPVNSEINVLNTAGYEKDKRLSASSGTVMDNDGTYVTGFIHAPTGSTVYLKNIVMPDEQSYNNLVCFYYSDKTYKLGFSYTSNVSKLETWDENGNLASIYIGQTEIEYIRICAKNIDEASIITVNQPIVDSAWVKTKHRFYSDDISVAGAESIPSYWQTALDNGVEAINTALCEAGRNKSAFLFYSDSHWNYGSQMAPTLLKYLHNHTGMAKTFFGGDIVNDEATDYDTMEYLWDWRRQLKDLPNHHSVPGNHDDGNATNNLFSEQYVYGYLLAAEETPDVVRGDSGLYYYIDNPAEQTRYLCLDTGYKDLNSLSVAQANFINESLKSTPVGWHIVTVAHIWFAPDYTQSSVRPIPIVGLSTTAASVATILDNYNARNGEFANCGAKVEFCIGGHVHRDYVGTTDGGIPIIVVETDSKHIRSELSYNSGTTDEASVNGIIADYNTGILNVVRVGRGNSFTVDLASGESTENPDDGGNSGEPTYTNVLAAVGYEVGRINSSGQFKTDRTDRKATGFINAKTGDTVYFKNISMLGSDYGRSIALYGSGQTFISGKAFVIPDGASYAAFEADGTMKSCYINIDNVEWVRFSFVDITADSIITINEPID